jgi:hypothetical protein
MLYVKIQNDRAVGAQTEYPGEERAALTFETRNDWKSFGRAEVVAAQLSLATGTKYIATDAGPHVSPRYDVIACPQVGQEVSKEFNGDSYPEGVIVSISPTLWRIETSTGATFFRRGKSGTWLESGTWSLTRGHVDKRNPSF